LSGTSRRSSNPSRRRSTFSDSSAPTGTDSWGSGEFEQGLLQFGLQLVGALFDLLQLRLDLL